MVLRMKKGAVNLLMDFQFESYPKLPKLDAFMNLTPSMSEDK